MNICLYKVFFSVETLGSTLIGVLVTELSKTVPRLLHHRGINSALQSMYVCVCMHVFICQH